MPAPALASVLVARIERELGRHRPLIVALDGPSGGGKSTLAAAVADLLPAAADGAPTVAVVDGDGFYGGGSPATWDRRDAAQKVDAVIDWRRQRPVLEALRAGREATWHPFDWDADDWDADEVPLLAEPARCAPADVVILEGAYSGRPELSDLVDLRVLLDVPTDVRRARLLARDGEDYHADWDARWREAEALYFGTIMPPERFDLVLREG